jgi:hypothetical protein
MTHDERLLLAIKFNQERVAGNLAGQIATRDLIKANSLSSAEISQLTSIYPSFVVGKAYMVDDILQYNNILYKVVQAHASQADWLPNSTLALFTPVAPIGVIPTWVQPTGAQDAYNIGNKVTFEGKTYESVINANTWSPTAYPAGWRIV